MVEKLDFFERKDWGEEATELTQKLLRENNIFCEPTIDPKEWINISRERKEYLQKYDLENGDLFVGKRKDKSDVKRDKISVYSLKNFIGKYYILWKTSLNECIVIEKENMKNINYSSAVSLNSGDPGFTYDQLIKLSHISFEQFIVLMKE